MKILDYGAGWRGLHVRQLREMGFDITGHDFGRNFDSAIHDPEALDGVYDIVYASNVLNVHYCLSAVQRTCAEMAAACRELHGILVVNYPKEPRKFEALTRETISFLLRSLFQDVQEVRGRSCPLWVCHDVNRRAATDLLLRCRPFDARDFKSANIRPSGAVGAGALVPRYVVEHIVKAVNAGPRSFRSALYNGGAL